MLDEGEEEKLSLGNQSEEAAIFLHRSGRWEVRMEIRDAQSMIFLRVPPEWVTGFVPIGIFF